MPLPTSVQKASYLSETLVTTADSTIYKFHCHQHLISQYTFTLQNCEVSSITTLII